MCSSQLGVEVRPADRLDDLAEPVGADAVLPAVPGSATSGIAQAVVRPASGSVTPVTWW